jgi:hypothetical protein
MFLSQFELYWEEIKVQGSNYNLSKDLITKFQNLSDKLKMVISKQPFETENRVVSWTTVHYLLPHQPFQAIEILETFHH